MSVRRADGLPPRRGDQDGVDYMWQISWEDRILLDIRARQKGLAPEVYAERFIEQELAEPGRRIVPSWIRDDVLARDHATCQVCKTTTGPMHVDHKHPRSRGGGVQLKNLWVLCRRCNLSKGSKTVEEFQESRQRKQGAR